VYGVHSKILIWPTIIEVVYETMRAFKQSKIRTDYRFYGFCERKHAKIVKKIKSKP